MGIDGDRILPKGIGYHNIGGFSPHARKGLQDIDVLRHLPAVLLHKNMAGPYDILGLGRIEPAAFDIGFQLLGRQRGHGLCVGVLFKQYLGHLVDLLVRTLCRKDRRDQQLKGIGKVQPRLCIGISRFQPIEYPRDPFLFLFSQLFLRLFSSVIRRHP